jgi:hypothetical protein
MQGVRALCDKYGILMIADEVMSGFGRTGKWFAVEHWDVIPDLMTMAKGLTSAYAPLGAVAMKPEIAAAFNDTPFESGLTYTSHPISLAAALANIQVMKEDRIVEHAAAMGPVLKRMLTDLGEGHPSVGEVRNIGLFGIIELVKDRKTKEPMAPWNGSSPEMTALKKYCLDQGLFLYTHWHTVLIIPPLVITEEQLREGFEILDRALENPVPGQVAAVHGGDIQGVQRPQGARVIPVDEVAADALQAGHGLQRRLESLRRVLDPDPPEIVGNGDAQEIEPDICGRGAMRADWFGVFLEVVLGQGVILRVHEGLEESPAPPGDEP